MIASLALLALIAADVASATALRIDDVATSSSDIDVDVNEPMDDGSVVTGDDYPSTETEYDEPSYNVTDFLDYWSSPDLSLQMAVLPHGTLMYVPSQKNLTEEYMPEPQMSQEIAIEGFPFTDELEDQTVDATFSYEVAGDGADTALINTITVTFTDNDEDDVARTDVAQLFLPHEDDCHVLYGVISDMDPRGTHWAELVVGVKSGPVPDEDTYKALSYNWNTNGVRPMNYDFASYTSFKISDGSSYYHESNVPDFTGYSLDHEGAYKEGNVTTVRIKQVITNSQDIMTAAGGFTIAGFGGFKRFIEFDSAVGSPIYIYSDPMM